MSKHLCWERHYIHKFSVLFGRLTQLSQEWIFFLSNYIFILFSVYMWIHTHIHMWRSQYNLCKSVLAFYHMYQGSGRDQGELDSNANHLLWLQEPLAPKPFHPLIHKWSLFIFTFSVSMCTSFYTHVGRCLCMFMGVHMVNTETQQSSTLFPEAVSLR